MGGDEVVEGSGDGDGDGGVVLNNVSLRIGVVEVGLSSMCIDIDVLADTAYELVCGLVELAERLPREMRAEGGFA